MELKSGHLLFFIRSFCGKRKNQRGDERRKMEKTKARKEINVELFLIE